MPVQSLPALRLKADGTIGRVLAKRVESLIFALAKRGRAQALPLFVFLGLTILYERKNYKQDSKNYLLDSFYEVLYRENLLDFRRISLGANIPFLNYL